ncbi:MAG: hypothetical protein U1F00_03980 [Rhodoferax sp.]
MSAVLQPAEARFEPAVAARLPEAGADIELSAYAHPWSITRTSAMRSRSATAPQLLMGAARCWATSSR